VRDYRDLKVWSKAHQLTLAVYRGTQSFPKEELFGLTSQIRRSLVSQSKPIWRKVAGAGLMGRWADLSKLPWDWGIELSCHLLLARDLGLMKAEEYSGFYDRSPRSCACCRRCHTRSDIP
jgi:23S rRNA-intervening sequence protein